MRHRAMLAVAALFLAGCDDRLPTAEHARAGGASSLLIPYYEYGCNYRVPRVRTIVRRTIPALDWAASINDNGQIAGFGTTATGATHAFVVGGGVATDLGTLGGFNSVALAIGDGGHVVGYSETASGGKDPFVWTQAGGMIDLGPLGAPGVLIGEARGVNGAGDIVGDGFVAYPNLQPTTFEQAFFRPAVGSLVNLGVLPGDNTSTAYGVNNRGQVVGVSVGLGVGRAFLWSAASGMTDLGALTADHPSTSATDVNDNGLVVGWSGAHAFVWAPPSVGWLSGTMVALGEFPDDVRSYAAGINNHGDVVGYSGNPLGQRPILWNVTWRCPVPIDVLIGTEPNAVSLSAGSLQVAILTVYGFDASAVDPYSLTIGDLLYNDTPLTFSLSGKTFVLTDVDADGDRDLVVYFDKGTMIKRGDLTASTTQLTLLGRLTAGQLIRGDVSVTVVK